MEDTKQADDHVRERIRSLLIGVLPDAQVECMIEVLREKVMMKFFSEIENSLQMTTSTVGETLSEFEVNGILEGSISKICDAVKSTIKNH